MKKRNMFIFVFLSITASALNYLMYPLLSRILAPSEYVNITVSLSLFTQISAFLSSITAITIGLSKSEENKQNNNIEQLQAVLSKIFLALAVVILIFSPIIMGWIQTPAFFAIPIALMMFFSVPISIMSGYLNGKKLLVKLGLLSLLSATNQFLIGFSTATLFRSSILTMLSMVVAQIITIAVAYIVFSKDRLPKIKRGSISYASLDSNIKQLVRYTAIASVAIMAISLIQILDLFIMQNIKHTDMKFYTDVYVVSRVVFFAGMIFIWPFLGEINVYNHFKNYKPFFELMGYFISITSLAIIALFFFGNPLMDLVFGVNYDNGLIRSVAILSVLYKFFLLIIIAVVLYLVVIRNNWAIYLSFVTSIVLITCSIIMGKNQTMSSVLTTLDILAAMIALISVSIILFKPIKHPDKC